VADLDALRGLARSLRGNAGSLRAAAEALASEPEPETRQRRRLLAVLVDEAERLSADVERLERLAATAGRSGRAAQPASELITRIASAAAASGFACVIRDPDPVPGQVRAAASIVDGIGGFLDTLRRETTVGGCALSTRVVDQHLLLDLAWEPQPTDLPHLLEWQGAALEEGPPGGGGLRAALREVDGEVWFNLDRDGSTAHLRLLLPRSDSAPPAAAAG